MIHSSGFSSFLTPAGLSGPPCHSTSHAPAPAPHPSPCCSHPAPLTPKRQVKGHRPRGAILTAFSLRRTTQPSLYVSCRLRGHTELPTLPFWSLFTFLLEESKGRGDSLSPLLPSHPPILSRLRCEHLQQRSQRMWQAARSPAPSRPAHGEGGNQCLLLTKVREQTHPQGSVL